MGIWNGEEELGFWTGGDELFVLKIDLPRLVTGVTLSALGDGAVRPDCNMFGPISRVEPTASAVIRLEAAEVEDVLGIVWANWADGANALGMSMFSGDEPTFEFVSARENPSGVEA